MAEGIVVKIWNVTVNKGERSGASQLASSIQYIENPEKVAMKMEDINFSQIHNELEYVKNELKTRNGLLVGGLRISDFSNATNEMMQVKKFFGKLDGRIALHGLISLDQEESTQKSAGKLMLLLEDVMEQVFPMNQVVYAVHTNTENMHLHFIVNTVGVDGKKIHMDCDFMKKVLQPIVNEKAIKYGFTPNKKWSKEHKKEVIPLPQRKMLLCKLIDHKVTINLYQNKSEISSQLQEAADKYTEENPNVTINVESIQGNDYNTNLKAKLISDDSVDIYALGDNITNMTDYVEDLSDQEWLKNAVDGSLDDVTLDGKVYGMPKTTWCREHGISDKSFFYWQRILREEAYLTTLESTLTPAVKRIQLQQLQILLKSK